MRDKNPLVKGYSPDSIGRNIAHALKRGLPHAQAVAIALETARREYRLKHPTGPFPRQLKFIGKVRGKNPISEKTAHKLRKAAPKTFQYMTDEEIKRGVKVKKKRKNPVNKKSSFTNLWRYKPVTGTWWLERHIEKPETAKQWLSIFQDDEPGVTFKISKRSPEQYKKKSRRKNPVSTLIKVFKHGTGAKKFEKVGYFTGTGWDTSIAKAEKYSAGAARKLALQLKVPAGWGLALVTG